MIYIGGVRNNSIFFASQQENFYYDCFFPYLRDNNIDTVWILGDFYENRKMLNISIMNRAYKFLEEFEKNNIKVYCLIGNHDVVYKNTNDISSLVPTTRSFSNIHLIREFETIDFDNVRVGFISWISPEIRDNALKWIQEVEANIICGHFEINTFEVVKGYLCNTGFDPSIFDRFDLVLSGHFHIRARSGSIQYVGNPYQTNWGEAGEVKGFHIFDTSNQNLEFVPNPTNIFDTIIYNDDFDIIKFDPLLYKDKILRVYPENGNSNDKKKLEMLFDKLASICYSIELVEDREVVITNNENDIVSDTSQLINQFLESCTISHLDCDLLHSIVFDIYNDALEKGSLQC